MIIALLQKDQAYLDVLLKNLPDSITSLIAETTDPIQLLSTVALWREDCVVISCHFEGTRFDVYEIATQVKAITPTCKVYAYTATDPGSNAHLDGVIRKPSGGHELHHPFEGLLKVLEKLLKGSTPDELKRTFSFVT